MSTPAALTQEEVSRLCIDWYRKLDVHAPIEQLLPLLADEGLEMFFPEGVSRGHAGFRAWYDRVTRLFFDEVHTMKDLQPIKPRGDQAEAQLVVNWQAHIWNPPDAKSKWLGFDAYQHWVVTRSLSGQPIILTYIVDELKPMPGSTAL